MGKFIPPEIVAKLCEISTEDVAMKLGLNVKSHRINCFMHDDQHPSLGFFGKNRCGWRCFVCDKGGNNAISFVMECLKCDFVEACSWLAQRYGIYLESNNHQKIKIPRASQTNHSRFGSYALEYSRQIDTDILDFVLKHTALTDSAKTFLFEERKLKETVVSAIGITSIDNSSELVDLLKSNFKEKDLADSNLVSMSGSGLYLRFYTPCLLFPYRSISGSLIGLQSRYIGKKKNAPRFQFLAASQTHLFNMPILNELPIGSDLYISEGITDCLALLSAGYNAVAIPSASNIPEKELPLLTKYSLHMFPDNDEAGQMAFAKLRSMMIRRGSTVIRERVPSEYKDFGAYYLAK
jgi:DNA primase